MPITETRTTGGALLLSPPVLVPRLSHDGAAVWDPHGASSSRGVSAAGPCPRPRARAQCRSHLRRDALEVPQPAPHADDLRPNPPSRLVGAKADIDASRPLGECLTTWKGRNSSATQHASHVRAGGQRFLHTTSLDEDARAMAGHHGMPDMSSGWRRRAPARRDERLDVEFCLFGVARYTASLARHSHAGPPEAPRSSANPQSHAHGFECSRPCPPGDTVGSPASHCPSRTMLGRSTRAANLPDAREAS